MNTFTNLIDESMILPFGKYKGFSIKHVIKTEPSYIIYLSKLQVNPKYAKNKIVMRIDSLAKNDEFIKIVAYNTKMPFGKYKDQLLKNIPNSYLKKTETWIKSTNLNYLNNTLYNAISQTIKLLDNLDTLYSLDI
jgi:uncharacterized protein (DUF3820 family)